MAGRTLMWHPPRAMAEEPEPDEPEGAALLAPLRDEDVTHTQEIVGRGGSSVVRKGLLRLPDHSQVEVAIKHLDGCPTEKEKRHFVKEYHISMRVAERCPNACRMYGYVSHEGALCLVMKLYERSLHQLLDARKSPDGKKYIKHTGA